MAELEECGAYFAKLWNERVKRAAEDRPDFHDGAREATREMDPRNFLGNLILLIVGGNDTTRNTITGTVYALNKYPDQYDKLRDNHALVAQSRAGGDPLADAACATCGAPR